MRHVILQENETREKYLLRVAAAYIRIHAPLRETIIYDEAECDGHCIIEDICNNLGIHKFDLTNVPEL